jgi:hypothetical protein
VVAITTLPEAVPWLVSHNTNEVTATSSFPGATPWLVMRATNGVAARTSLVIDGTIEVAAITTVPEAITRVPQAIGWLVTLATNEVTAITPDLAAITSEVPLATNGVIATTTLPEAITWLVTPATNEVIAATSFPDATTSLVPIYPSRVPTPDYDRVWRALVEDAVDPAASVPVSDAERELKAAGFDTNAERAKAEAVIAELLNAGAPAKQEPDAAPEGHAWARGEDPPARKPRAPSRVVWLAAALLAAATAGGLMYAVGHRSNPPDVPPEPPQPAPTASAAPVPAPDRPAPSSLKPVRPPPQDWKVAPPH